MKLIQAPMFSFTTSTQSSCCVSNSYTTSLPPKIPPFPFDSKGARDIFTSDACFPVLWPYQVYRRADTHLAKVDCKDSVGAGTLDIHLGAGCGSGESSLFQALDQLQWEKGYIFRPGAKPPTPHIHMKRKSTTPSCFNKLLYYRIKHGKNLPRHAAKQ